jgi:hypothetical protein
MHEANTQVTSSVVPESLRLTIFPRFIGTEHMLHFEALVYGWMRRLSEDYTGGHWNFYTLSNGGFYMAPAASADLRILVEGNCFDGKLSPDAAGLVACLFALNQLACETQLTRLVDLYHQVRNFSLDHAQAALICRAID